jgi:hypothetical protein
VLRGLLLLLVLFAVRQFDPPSHPLPWAGSAAGAGTGAGQPGQRKRLHTWAGEVVVQAALAASACSTRSLGPATAAISSLPVTFSTATWASASEGPLSCAGPTPRRTPEPLSVQGEHGSPTRPVDTLRAAPALLTTQAAAAGSRR